MEKDWYLVTYLKCLMDSGSDTGIAGKAKGLMSLEMRNTTIHTCIGKKIKLLKKLRFNLLTVRVLYKMVRLK